MTGSVGVMLFLWHKQPATESDATLTRHARATRHKRVPHVGVSGIRMEVWLLAAIA